MAPPTPSDTLVARVRSSCEALLQHDDCAVGVDAERIRTFIEELDWQQYNELAEPMRFPLNFKSVEDEVNFLTLWGLLNFGSGYRKDLHKYCSRGAAETILFGLIGMYITEPRLDASFFANVSIDVLANYFSIPLDRDEELSQGIYISKPGPLRPFAEMLHKVVTECGQELLDRKFANFGAFVLANLKKTPDDEKPSATYLVDQLVAAFPAFDDRRDSRGDSRLYLKRAQLVAASLRRRFHDSNPDFDFADVHDLTALSDNVLPCVLRALGILQYSTELAAHVDSGEELQAGDWECDIRAGAVVACDRIVAESKGRINILDLDTYLWRVGKEPRFRGLERHATRDTFFY